MRRFLMLFIVLGIFNLSFPGGVMAQDATLYGDWKGNLLLPNGAQLPLVIHLSNEDGSAKGSLDSPAQNAVGIPMTNVVVSAATLNFEVKNLDITFQGSYDSELQTIEGTFSQRGADMPLRLERTTSPTTMRRPQTPESPFPYPSREVAFTSPVSGGKLSGTLTMPAEGEPRAAIVLISGSGAQDRDETILGHKPFLVISDFLTRSGYAVLRMDDRGVGGSSGNISEATTLEFADDIDAAVQFLTSQPSIKKIGLLGHSEGALVGAIAAARNSKISFLVSLAGPGVPSIQLLTRQIELLGQAQEVSPSKIDQLKSLHEALYRELAALGPGAPLTQEIKHTVQEIASLQGQSGNEAAVEAMLAGVDTKWFREFIKFDPAAFWSAVKVPVLAMNGARDTQVHAETNLSHIAERLKVAGNESVEVKALPDLNHLFQHCDTGLPAEYGEIEETIAPEVLSSILEWLDAHLGNV